MIVPPLRGWMSMEFHVSGFGLRFERKGEAYGFQCVASEGGVELGGTVQRDVSGTEAGRRVGKDAETRRGGDAGKLRACEVETDYGDHERGGGSTQREGTEEGIEEAGEMD